MKTLNELREYFADDLFAMKLGITIEEVAEDFARCSLTLDDWHRNALGSPQGGVLFTLADFTFAVAANSGDAIVVTLSCSIEYLKPARGGKLYAVAACYSSTKSLCRYQIDITDTNGALVARAAAVGFRRG